MFMQVDDPRNPWRMMGSYFLCGVFFLIFGGLAALDLILVFDSVIIIKPGWLGFVLFPVNGGLCIASLFWWGLVETRPPRMLVYERF